MPFRRLLNVAYAALAYGKDDDELAELDNDLEMEPIVASGRKKRTKSTGDVAGLMAAAAMPQVGR